MDDHNKFDEFLARVERYLLRIVIFALFLMALKRFFLSEVQANSQIHIKSPPAATHCIHKTEELVMKDLGADSNIPICNGIRDHVLSKSRSSPPHRGKAPPARSCRNQKCCCGDK